MLKQDRPSYIEIDYEVIGSAPHPPTADEPIEAVSDRQPIMEKPSKATIRNVLQSSSQFINLGNGKFGFLPYLCNGSFPRLPPEPSPYVGVDDENEAVDYAMTIAAAWIGTPGAIARFAARQTS